MRFEIAMLALAVITGEGPTGWMIKSLISTNANRNILIQPDMGEQMRHIPRPASTD